MLTQPSAETLALLKAASSSLTETPKDYGVSDMAISLINLLTGEVMKSLKRLPMPCSPQTSLSAALNAALSLNGEVLTQVADAMLSGKPYSISVSVTGCASFRQRENLYGTDSGV